MPQQKYYFIVLIWAWQAIKAMGCGLCDEDGQTSITCMSTVDKQVNLYVELLPKGEIYLQCLHLTDVDYSSMDGCEFTSVTHVQFLGCALPNISYKEVLQTIGVNPGNLRSLTLSNVSRKGVLTQQHLQGLDDLQLLSVTGIHSLTNDAFKATPKLEFIEISNSAISQLATDLLHNMTNLQIVLLQHNRLAELPTQLFSGTPGLHTIQLHDNHITILQEDLFKGLKSLRTLTVTKNKLEKLFSNLFSDNSLMESLDLSENLLSEIETEAFSNLLKLKALNLSHNRLRTLPQDTLKNCKGLEKLELSNNSLTHLGITNVFPQDSSLTYVDLGYNNLNITSVRNFALNTQKKLQHVFLNNNNINVIPLSFNNVFINLKTVDLSRNSFEYLEFSSFVFQSNLVELNLKYNKLKNVDFNWSFSLLKTKMVKLALEGNPLLCDCRNYGFFRVLQGKPFESINNTVEVIVVDIDKVFCEFPSGGRENLREIQTEALTCKILGVDDCSNAYRIHDKMILVNCSYQNLKSIQSLNLTQKIIQHNFTLILANNSFTSLVGLQTYTHLINLMVPYNKLSNLNMSHLPPNLKALDVRGNNLTTLPSVLLHHLNATDMSLKLGGNPWHCNCDMLDLFQFLHVPSRKVNDFGALQCQEDGQPLMSLSEYDLCPFFMQPMVIVTIVAILIFLILFAVLGTVSFYKYKQGIKVWLYAHHMCLWFITEDELDADKKYDAFISYSHKDEEFVTKVLVPGLECGEPKYRVCLHYRDWMPGEYIQNQIMQSVEASRRTIIVLSSSFIESVWGQLEFLAAHSQALQDRTNRLIIIVYGKIPSENDLDEKLKLYITTKTYVRWGDKKFWEKLRYIMPHPPDLVQKIRKSKKTNKLELCKSTPKQSVC